VPQYYKLLQESTVVAGQKVRIEQETDSSAVFEGGWGFGQVLCRQAMEIAMAKAKNQSVAAVTLYNCSHIGRVGEYVEMAVEKNMIGIVSCNNHGAARLTSPFGGIDARMSPNPIAFGFPTGGAFPIIIDMTASVVAEGKIRVKKNLGQNLPEGWALDADGNPITDPNAFYGPPRGSILPFGGISAHKGYALGIAVDILDGALGGGGCSRDGADRLGNGVFLLALDVDRFKAVDAFKEDVDNFVQFLKSSRRMPGFDEITMPGELEFRRRQQLEKEGISVDDTTWQQICETAEAVNVSLA
jgi:uncharacterized oxidoreductase